MHKCSTNKGFKNLKRSNFNIVTAENFNNEEWALIGRLSKEEETQLCDFYENYFDGTMQFSEFRYFYLKEIILPKRRGSK